MRSRVVRITLTLLVVTGIGTAAYYYSTNLARINASLQSATSFTTARMAAARAAQDFRSEQQAYVAAGQNEAFWFERATRSLGALRTAITSLERQATAPEARTSIADVSAAADELEALDRRVRGYVSSGQRLLAADIIFSGGIDLTSRVLAGLDAAAEHEGRVQTDTRTRAVREQMIAGAAAAAIAVVALLLLTPAAQQAKTPGPDPLFQDPARDGLLNLELRPATPSARPAVRPVETRKEPQTTVAAVAKASAADASPKAPSRPASRAVTLPADERRSAPMPPQQPVRLDELAAVCADLARLSDTGAIPAILERAAGTIDASGLVLWVADERGAELLPIAAHGYASNVLSRMRGLPTDSENATAGAFRTGLLQTVRGDRNSNGAIAAPLVSPAGPLGVLALEMRHEGEKRPERLAAATIVASQLATIVGPAAARVQESNDGSADRPANSVR